MRLMADTDLRSGDQRSRDESCGRTTPAVPLTMTAEAFSELVELIYEGPFEQPMWSSALKRIQRDLRAYWAILVLRPATTNAPALVVAAGLGTAFITYESPYTSFREFSMDPFTDLPEGEVVTVDELIGAEQWLNSDFYLQFVKPRGIRHTLGADLRTRNDVECRFRICRTLGTAPFDENDRAYCRALLPHLRRAVYTHSRLDAIDSERKLWVDAVDGMRVGTVILDEAGAIIKTNHAADELLARREGLRLVNGAIVCEVPAETRELQRCIREALAAPFGTRHHQAEALAIGRGAGRSKLGVLVRPIPLGELSEGRHRPAVAIFIRDSEQGSQPSQATIMQLFDLTPAEATLALRLANGETLDEASEQLGIRRNTARAHLRSIFAKVGVTRQTMLVRVILNSVALLSEPLAGAEAPPR